MTILALEPDTIANPAEVSDADAEAAYREDRRQGSPVRRAREARPAADPVSQRGRRRRGRGQAQGRRELRRPRQGARPQSRGHRHRRDDQGRHARQGRGRRRLRLAAGGRQRRAQEPVRSGHRSRQGHHAVHGQALRGGRRRGEDGRSPLPAPATRSRPCTTRSRTRGFPAKPLVEAAKAVGLTGANDRRGRRRGPRSQGRAGQPAGQGGTVARRFRFRRRAGRGGAATPRTAASSGLRSPRSIRRTTSPSRRQSPRSRSSGAPKRSTRRSPARRTISSSRSAPAETSPTQRRARARR